MAVHDREGGLPLPTRGGSIPVSGVWVPKMADALCGLRILTDQATESISA
jgi:hypothetical protein